MNSYLFLLLIPFLFSTNNVTSLSEVSGKVIAIKDGDTIVILFDKTQITVRLEHIDCPEKNQPFGNVAKKYISKLCFGKQVKIVGKGKKDRNGRLIGEVIVDTTNINKEMVKAGLAWHFKKYSKDNSYASLETTAKTAKLGLWKDAAPIAPWLWRKK